MLLPQTEQEDTTIIREDLGITALKYSSPKVPSSIEFCGKVIDLSRFDRHERMDRELLAFTYMHSTSLQMLKKANRYFPIVEPILKENGIPDDFKYLMVIESNMNPTARSSAGAAGTMANSCKVREGITDWRLTTMWMNVTILRKRLVPPAVI